VDIALHDLLGQQLGASLGDLFGRVHESLPTSITIGIKPTAEALAEADEYVGRGFHVLKVKTGKSLEEDLERLARLRAHVGAGVVIRADANQGYTLEETRRFFAETAALDIEFIEQPVKAALVDELRALPDGQRRHVAADESLLTPADALRLASAPQPAGIFNIKLMKCGGLRPARAIAAIAEAGGVGPDVGVHGRELHQHHRRLARRPGQPRHPLPGPGRQLRSGPGRGRGRVHRGARNDAASGGPRAGRAAARLKVL
jgi:L-alanine-DL-glutamate epimerase-like enolase superfamily enzyme